MLPGLTGSWAGNGQHPSEPWIRLWQDPGGFAMPEDQQDYAVDCEAMD